MSRSNDFLPIEREGMWNELYRALSQTTHELSCELDPSRRIWTCREHMLEKHADPASDHEAPVSSAEVECGGQAEVMVSLPGGVAACRSHANWLLEHPFHVWLNYPLERRDGRWIDPRLRVRG